MPKRETVKGSTGGGRLRRIRGRNGRGRPRTVPLRRFERSARTGSRRGRRSGGQRSRLIERTRRKDCDYVSNKEDSDRCIANFTDSEFNGVEMELLSVRTVRDLVGPARAAEPTCYDLVVGRTPSFDPIALRNLLARIVSTMNGSDRDGIVKSIEAGRRRRWGWQRRTDWKRDPGRIIEETRLGIVTAATQSTKN